ncbi:hypothetical protein COU57_05215 [Candidatus Pacearchaeota archaeon CG10_big_fil_rev_8_21_14_0_10_32_14]|nr:MAG: hypothetical protein COU57_05215 [Candidatus Pacearchaeota archaeon CG10_big_fil_rev_8_21_14_0_10_32_14]
MALLRNTATLRIKPGCQESKIENFGNDRYLVKVTSKEQTQIITELKEMFSHYLGVPASKIQIFSGLGDNDKTLRIER